MSDDYRIEQADKPAWGVIGPAISEFNKEQAGEDNARSLCFVLLGPGDEILGGIIGATYWDWLHVDLMWINKDLRGRGYGHQLLTLAEDEARLRGAKQAYLDTFSFQAPGFYQKHGYQVFGELEGFPAGHQRYFLTKQL